MAVQNDLPLQFVPVLLDMVVLDHDDHHIHLAQEFVEVEHLTTDHLPVKQGVIGLEGLREVALLALEELERRALADIVDVLLVGKAVESYAAAVGDAVLLHYLVNAIEDEFRLAVVGLHAFVDDLREGRIVANEEPRIDRDAMPADAGARLEDVHARVHVADADDLVHIHIVVPADAGEFVRECDVDRAEGVLHDLGHFRGADVRDNDFALAKCGVVLLDLLADGSVVGADRAVVVQEFVDHVAGDDALGGVDEVHALAGGLDDRPDRLIDGARGNGRFDDDGRAFLADFEHVLDRRYDVAGIYFLAEFIIWSRDRDDVGVRLLVLRGELDAFGYCRLEKLVQAVFLEGGPARVERRDEFFVVVRSDDFHSVGSHHKCGRKTDIAEADNV